MIIIEGYVSKKDDSEEWLSMSFKERQRTNGRGDGMSEYIVRETGYPGTITQEIVGELVRCKDCKRFPVGQDKDGWVRWPEDEIGFEDDTCPYYCEDGYYSKMPPENGYCHKGERREDDSD